MHSTLDIKMPFYQLEVDSRKAGLEHSAVHFQVI